VNRQINYIIHAFLLVLLLAAGYFVVNKIISAELINESNEVIDYDSIGPDSISAASSQGRTLFLSKCASCHNVFKDMAGPALGSFEERGPWSDRKKLYEWIKNPEAFMKKDSYTKQLKEKFGSVMTPFPDLTNDEIDVIIQYINSSY